MYFIIEMNRRTEASNWREVQTFKCVHIDHFEGLVNDGDGHDAIIATCSDSGKARKIIKALEMVN